MADQEDTPTTEENEDVVTGETAVAVPAEVIDVPADLAGGREVAEELLSGAIAWLNETYVRKGMEVVVEVGEYVIDTFFAGDADNFRKHRNGHVTFRELAARQDALRMSYVWIWRAVSVVDQLRLLPGDARTQLPYTHHTLLLPLKDDREKAKLAKKAIEKGLKKHELAALVRKAKGKSNAGRPPLPRFVKTVNKLEKLAVEDEELWGDIEDIDDLAPDEAKRLFSALSGMKLRCEKLQELLQPKMPGAGSTGE